MQYRRANHNDIERLSEICRMCFPQSLRWRGPESAAGKRLSLFLDSETCRTRVCLENETIEGFAVIVVDIGRFSRQKNEDRFGLGDLLILSLTHPVLVVSKFLSKLSTRQVENKGADKQAGGVLWIELMAVSPAARCKGIGSGLLSLCISCAQESGRETVKLSVKKKNHNAQRFYLDSGFTQTGESGDSFIYTRFCKPEAVNAS